MTDLYKNAGDLNSCLHTCAASILTSDLSPSPGRGFWKHSKIIYLLSITSLFTEKLTWSWQKKYGLRTFEISPNSTNASSSNRLRDDIHIWKTPLDWCQPALTGPILATWFFSASRSSSRIRSRDHYPKEKTNRKRYFQHPAPFCHKASGSDVCYPRYRSHPESKSISKPERDRSCMGF